MLHNIVLRTPTQTSLMGKFIAHYGIQSSLLIQHKKEPSLFLKSRRKLVLQQKGSVIIKERKVFFNNNNLHRVVDLSLPQYSLQLLMRIYEKV